MENYYRATTFCADFLHDLLNAYKKRGRTQIFPLVKNGHVANLSYLMRKSFADFLEKAKREPFFPLWQKVPWVYWK